MPVQNGSAGFAGELLQPPWRQVFSDDADPAPSGPHAVAMSVRALGDAFDAGPLAASLGGER
jgi:hypothetical protein